MPSRSSARGIVASTGYASGPLFMIGPAATTYTSSGNPVIESTRLRDALSISAAAVTSLMAEADADSAAILEFQVAMMEDDSLSELAFDAIATGTDAATAWTDLMLATIHEYASAEDAYFAARSADLRDIFDRVLRALSGAGDTAAPPGAILCGRDLTPSQFLAMDWKAGGAIVLCEGSPASHVAMLARTRGVPMIVGVGEIDAVNDDVVLVDAEHGRITVQPDTDDRHDFLKASTEYRQLMLSARGLLGKPSFTADGVAISMQVNIAGPADVEHIDIAHCDGVGLMRTEFLFAHGMPDEETQYRAYRKVLEWAAGKPVTIRTIDAGGDKPVPGLTVEETNPFLGLRGIRLSLTREDVFRVQIRALLRAAAHGNLKVMFPMIGVAAEYHAAKALFEDEAKNLGVSKIPPLGIMVEVPAVAIAPEAFADVAFFSIGSNDLTQYVMAAARDNFSVAALNDVRHPAVQSLIRSVAEFADRRAIPLSLCGDAGGDPHAIPALLRAGLRTLSVAPAQLPLAKAAIAQAHAHG